MSDATMATPMQSGALKNTKQAADYLGISNRTVWGLANSGKLPTVRIGSRVLFRPADLDAFVDQNRSRGPTA